LATLSAKEEIVEASRTIIIPNVMGMRFCTGSSFSCEIKAEIFSALLTEFKKVLVQNVSTNLTVMRLHIELKDRPSNRWRPGPEPCRMQGVALKRMVQGANFVI
jgi:hypothetical protein